MPYNYQTEKDGSHQTFQPILSVWSFDMQPSAIDAQARQELGADGREAGVEFEEYAPYPFASDKISISDKRVPLQTLLRRFEQHTISAPLIQRGAGIWDDEQQSQLIESIMLRIPVPLFYVAEDEEVNWKVVDGLQRITAIKRYVYDKEFPLVGLEFMHELEGMKFDQLPLKFQTRILETEFQFAIINPSTPQNVQRNVFKRLNTGGMPLTAQEIRHALYYGPSAVLLQELAHSESFRSATTQSVNDSRMAGRELVLRFFAFLIRGIHAYPKNEDMDAFLCDTMQIINSFPEFIQDKLAATQANPYLLNEAKFKTTRELRDLFELAMTRASALFGSHAFRKSLPINNLTRSPINKALFEVWSVVLSNLLENDFKILLQNRNTLYIKLYNATYEDPSYAFEKYISRDSHKISGVIGRYLIIESIIRDVLTGEGT
jgi:hypothetical protein